MSKRPGIAIKISAALCIVLFFLAVSRLRGTPARTLLNGNDVLTAQENTPFDQAQALAELGKKITGKENKPAEEVFKNIRLLKGVPAGRLLRIWNWDTPSRWASIACIATSSTSGRKMTSRLSKSLATWQRW